MTNTETRTHQFNTAELKKINSIQKLSIVIIALGVVLCIFGILLLAKPSAKEEELPLMPNLVGQNRETAEAQLVDFEAEIKIEYGQSDIYASGIVYEQSIEEGEAIEPGTEIILYIVGDGVNEDDENTDGSLITTPSENVPIEGMEPEGKTKQHSEGSSDSGGYNNSGATNDKGSNTNDKDAGTDKGSGNAGTDKGSGNADTNKGSGNAGTDKGSGNAGTDNGSGNADTNKGSGNADTDNGSGKDAGTDNGSGKDAGTDNGSGNAGTDNGSGNAGTDNGSGNAGTDNGSGNGGNGEGSTSGGVLQSFFGSLF